MFFKCTDFNFFHQNFFFSFFLMECVEHMFAPYTVLHVNRGVKGVLTWTHQSAKPFRWVATRDSRRIHLDSHVVFHGRGFRMARVLLPHRALVRAHQGLAQFVLAQGGGQAVQQQQKHRLEVHGRLGGVWSGVLRRVRGARNSEERWSAWSGDHQEVVDIPTTTLLHCEWRINTTRLQTYKCQEKTVSATCAQCLFANIDGALRDGRGTRSWFDGWLPEEDGRWIGRRIMWQRLISAYALIIVFLGVGWERLTWIHVSESGVLRGNSGAGRGGWQRSYCFLRYIHWTFCNGLVPVIVLERNENKCEKYLAWCTSFSVDHILNMTLNARIT